MAKSVSPSFNLFGNSNLLETPDVVEVPKEHLSLLQPLDLSAYKLSPGASAAGAEVDKLFSSMQAQFEAQTAQAQAYSEAQQKQIAANMEAVLRMQEERKKAEEEARKKAEEAKKELEKSIDEDPLAIIRTDLDAVLNSEVYKNAGDKQKRDLLAEAAKQYEADLTAQGLDAKYVKKLVDTFKINGERDVVEYINKSEKDDWDIVNDLIVPVKGAIDRTRSAMHTKDARIIDQAIADLKAGKEVSGWAVDEILDRDPSLRKYLDVTSGVYSGVTQGVGSTFKLKQGVASEFTTAANKTWNTAIDKAVALEANAQKIDASRSADAQRHWKNYDYEAAKIDNAEKAGQISGFDSFLSHGMLFLSNPTVPLDKAAPSMIKAVGETVLLDRTVNAATAAGAAIGSVVPVLGTGAGAVAGRVVGTTVSLARKAMPFLASAVVSGKATEEEIINNARETISALDVNNKDDLKTLQAMPGWNEMLARSDNNPELAKLRMSAFASEDAAFAGAITGAIAGLVGPEAFLARGATKLIVRSTLSKPATVAATVGKTAGAAALSSASEGAEEAMTQYLSNYASIYSSDDGRGLTSHLMATWGEAPLMEGVANAAAQGMGVGLIAGGAGGAMGFNSDLAATEKAISQQRVKNEVNFIKNGVENLTAEVDTLLASGKVDQKVLTETLLSGFRTQTKELSTTASKYSYRDEQQGKQMVYDHIIEPVLERSGVTTEQAAEVVRKISTAFPEVNTNAYAQATDTAFIKALKADTLEQAEAIYGKPLSTLRADTWRVYNNKDTGSVTDLDQAQAAATLVRSVLSEGDVLTVQRAGAVLRTMYGYRNADNKLVDGIIHKHPNLSDSQLDAVLELAKTELDAYNRRETNEERQAREQGEQTGQQPNDGGVPRDGGNGSVAVGTPSQGQDQANQETNLGELGGQEQGGQTTTATQGGRGGRSRKTTQSSDANDVTTETGGTVTGTAETQGTVSNTDSTPTPRQPSETPTSDGGNGQTVQAPEYTGPANTAAESTPDGSGVTGATQTERSTDGERTTATTQADAGAVGNTTTDTQPKKGKLSSKKPEPKAKPKGGLTSNKPKTKRGTKNDEETSTRQQTTAPRTDDERSESGSRTDAKSPDEQSGAVREQSPVNDGKNQTAKSTDADVRQEAEVGKKLNSKKPTSKKDTPKETTADRATDKAEPKKGQLAANIESVYKVIDNVKLDATSNTVLTILVNRDKKASNPNTKREIMTDLAVASATNDTTVFDKYTKQYVVDGERTSKKTKLERIKALADTLWDSVKALVVAVSISLAALTGTSMVAPVDAQASTTYTQTDLSQQAKDTASHVVQTKDNGGKPFIVADKMSGNITLFDANGKVLTTAPALYGSEVGDTLQDTNRQTPAGRFTLTYSKEDKALGDMQVLDGVSMQDGNTNYVWAIHRVITPKGENRLNRLNSKTASDNRISDGCINVPAEFFNKHLNQQFDGVLYVLPETANFNGTMFNNTTVSDRANITEQSGRSEGTTGTTSTETPNATTMESTTPTAEQIGNIGKHPLLTADDIKAANNRILGLPDEAPTPADEPARVGDNPSTQQAVIETVTVDGKSHTTALVEQGQLTPAEERADTTFDTLPTTEKSSDGFSVSDIAIALGSLVGLGAGVVKLRRVRRNGKVEVEPVLDDTEATADTETVTETPTEPKSATDKLKSLASRKKQPESNRRVVENDQDLVSQIRSELMALEDLQDNIAAQQLLYAMAGNSSELAVGFAANWNPLMRSINQALQDDTNAFEPNSKTFSWRIDRKGTDDESKANGPVSSLYHRYMQFSGGATPNLERFLELTGGKRIGLMQDSFKLSASLAKINATRNALFGSFNTRVLKDIEKTMLDHEFNPEYAKRIKALGKKPSNGDIGYSIPHDFGMYATYMHAYHEAYDWQIKSMTNVAKHHATEAEYAVEKALEVVRKYTDDDQVIKAIANLIESDRTDGEIEAGLRSYDISHNDLSRVKRFKRDYHESMTKADRQYELIDATQEYYENAKDVTGKTDYPLPIGMTKQDIEAKMKALEDLYDKDALEKTAKAIFRANELAVQEAVMRGSYTSQELATIKAAGFKMYVPLHKAKSETDTSVGDVLETGYFDVYEESSREYRAMGLTPDLVRYHRKGMTSPPNDAYTNLLPFVQNQMGRAAESDFKYGIRELAEGTNPTIASLSAWKKDGVIEYTDTEGLIRIPASMRSDVLPEYLRNHVGVRMRGTTVVEVPHETERGKFVKKLVESDYIYYFTDIKVQNELTHVAQANDKLRRNFFTNNLYTIQRWQAALMTSKRPVWNFWNFFKEASERTITMMFRPVADADGNRISSRKLATTNIKNLAKISSSMELQAEITDYIRYREITTPLQRILAEMDDAGALQLYTSTVDRHNAMQDEVKSELDKAVEHIGKNAKKLASKYKVSSKALSNAESLAEWYQVRLVETPQVVNALATYMTYKQLGVNKKEATNRTRDMFDPLRLNSPAVNKLASFFPFVRSILAGNYNTARTVDMITQDPKMMAIAVLGVMSSVALLALALSALGDDDETGEPYAERLTFGDLSRGLPIRAGNDVFFVPIGFGAPNILWSMGAGLALGTVNGVEPSEIISNTLMMAVKNTVPFSPASGDENRSLTGVLLSLVPAMVRPVAEVMLNQRAFGGSAIVTARNVPEGYDKADVSAWGTPEAYKDMAKTLASVGLDMHPEQLRHLIQGYALQGPLRAIDAALQDKGAKSGGVLMDKGETLGPLMTALGADINYQTNRFSYRNAFYELQEKEKEILKKYDVTATRSGADTLDDVTSFAGMSGLDSSRIKQDDSNIARVRNELVKKGATLDEVQFIIDMNYAKLDYRKATSEAGKAATHYYRGVKSGEASDKTAPSVYQEQFLMAELEMNQFVKKYLRLLSED